jgi:hypothetical protein
LYTQIVFFVPIFSLSDITLIARVVHCVPRITVITQHACVVERIKVLIAITIHTILLYGIPKLASETLIIFITPMLYPIYSCLIAWVTSISIPVCPIFTWDTLYTIKML